MEITVKVTSPQDKPLDFENEVKRMAEKIEKILNEKPNGLDEYHIIINEPMAKEVIWKIENIYRLAGWKNVRAFIDNSSSNNFKSITLYR